MLKLRNLKESIKSKAKLTDMCKADLCQVLGESVHFAVSIASFAVSSQEMKG